MTECSSKPICCHSARDKCLIGSFDTFPPAAMLPAPSTIQYSPPSERNIKFSSDTAATELRLHVERCLGGIIVGTPFRPSTQCRPTHNPVAHLSHQNRMPSIVRLQPIGAFHYIFWLGIEGRRCCKNCFVIDLGNRLHILELSRSNRHRWFVGIRVFLFQI